MEKFSFLFNITDSKLYPNPKEMPENGGKGGGMKAVSLSQDWPKK
jgi:hypothetical protein